ncbi:hypothetical protein [Streptomyces sp. t39]|uniref:hypothetical protein n=1 Tax=Streptomyces sp. t39 TaxID=1828156 RepID=UPI0011CE3CBA|nr:hypothetical protein [Streptomyces sp. t39]TXS55237.1 hypothetical protein EAO77_02750 [Streptomyces sp. t39]
MPTPAHQLPGGPTDLNRRVAALERELRELRAARRARHTSLDVDGALRLVDAQGNVLTEMTSSFGGSRAAVAAYEERSERQFYAALAAGDLAFGIEGMRRQDEGRVAFADLGDRLELYLSSGSRESAASSLMVMYSGTAPGSGDSLIDLVTDKVAVGGVLTAGSIAVGTTTVTPSAANIPTSFMVTGLNVRGSNLRAYVTAATAVPGGAGVTGVGATNVTSGGFTLWVTRANTTATALYWMVIGQ